MLSIELEKKFGALPATHRVPDVFAENLTVVFCGTALGFISAKRRAYYAHPGNLFWRTLYATGMTPHIILPPNYTDVRLHHIGLTDLCKDAYGLDTQLPPNAFDIKALQKKFLCTAHVIWRSLAKLQPLHVSANPQANCRMACSPKRLGTYNYSYCHRHPVRHAAIGMRLSGRTWLIWCVVHSPFPHAC